MVKDIWTLHRGLDFDKRHYIFPQQTSYKAYILRILQTIDCVMQY